MSIEAEIRENEFVTRKPGDESEFLITETQLQILLGVVHAAQAFVEADRADDEAIGAMLASVSPDANEEEKLRDAQKETARALNKARDELDAALKEWDAA